MNIRQTIKKTPKGSHHRFEFHQLDFQTKQTKNFIPKINNDILDM